MLIRLVYVSILQPDVTEEGISAIVSHASGANKLTRITGVIAFENGRVCQVLEGHDGAVDKLFEAILADPRHHSITLLARPEVPERRFPDWSMVRKSMTDIIIYAYAKDPAKLGF